MRNLKDVIRDLQDITRELSEWQRDLEQRGERQAGMAMGLEHEQQAQMNDQIRVPDAV